MLGLLILSSAQALSADVLLLVHGYMSGAQAWRHSGVSQALEGQRWAEQGILHARSIFNNASQIGASRIRRRKHCRAPLPA